MRRLCVARSSEYWNNTSMWLPASRSGDSCRHVEGIFEISQSVMRLQIQSISVEEIWWSMPTDLAQCR